MSTAAAPSPAPNPAASPVLLELSPLDAAGAVEVSEAAAAVPVPLLVWVGDVVGIMLVLPVVVSLPPSVLVVVPSVTRGLLWVNGVVVDVMPGQLVLPITVTVEGWVSPNFTAFLPVSQEQSLSPGQQYFNQGQSSVPQYIYTHHHDSASEGAFGA